MSKIDSNPSKKTLYLDVGNSSIKGAYKNAMDWEAIHAQKKYSASDLITWIDRHPEKFEEIIVASVRKDVQQAIREQLQHVKIRELQIKDIPIELLDYETIESLGIDRFLACYGATGQTTESVVVIDAGTAITIDFMDQDDVYHGGVITPGIHIFRELLAEKAPALPAVDMSIPKTWPGKSTEDAMRWGQGGFYKLAIEAMLEKYKDRFGHFELFVTGGQASGLSKILEPEIKLRPFLVFDGMERLHKKVRQNS